MNRKLLILNLVLAAVLAYAGVQFRSLWKASKAREVKELGAKVTTTAPPSFPPTPAPSAVMATSYLEIPHKFLLDPSRNSDVAPEPPPAPPPPKPMPPLPLYHGQMNLGDGLFAILSMSKTSPHEAIHKGETIGEFKLLSVNREGIDLEWDGKTVHKSLDELTDRSAVQQQQADANQQRAANVAAPPPAPVQEKPLGPNAANEGADGVRGCQAGDSYPAGAVVDGYRKTLKASPFGPICSWVPVAGAAGR